MYSNPSILSLNFSYLCLLASLCPLLGSVPFNAINSYQTDDHCQIYGVVAAAIGNSYWTCLLWGDPNAEYRYLGIDGRDGFSSPFNVRATRCGERDVGSHSVAKHNMHRDSGLVSNLL